MPSSKRKANGSRALLLSDLTRHGYVVVSDQILSLLDPSDLLTLLCVNRALHEAALRFFNSRATRLDLRSLLHLDNFRRRLSQRPPEIDLCSDEEETEELEKTAVPEKTRVVETALGEVTEALRLELSLLGLMSPVSDCRLRGLLQRLMKLTPRLLGVRGLFLTPRDVEQFGLRQLRSLELSLGASGDRPLRQESRELGGLLELMGPQLEELRLAGVVESRLPKLGAIFHRLRVFDASRVFGGLGERSIVFWLSALLSKPHLLTQLRLTPSLRLGYEERSQLAVLSHILRQTTALNHFTLPSVISLFGRPDQTLQEQLDVLSAVRGLSPSLRSFSVFCHGGRALSWPQVALEEAIASLKNLRSLQLPAPHRAELTLLYQDDTLLDPVTRTEYRANRLAVVSYEPGPQMFGRAPLGRLSLALPGLRELTIDAGRLRCNLLSFFLPIHFASLRFLSLTGFEPVIHGPISNLQRTSVTDLRLQSDMEYGPDLGLSAAHLRLRSLSVAVGSSQTWRRHVSRLRSLSATTAAALRRLTLIGRQLCLSNLLDSPDRFPVLDHVQLHLPDLTQDFLTTVCALPANPNIHLRSISAQRYEQLRFLVQS